MRLAAETACLASLTTGSVIRMSSRYLGVCCCSRCRAVMRWSACMRRRALRVRFVKPFTPLGNWSSRSSTSRVRVRTVSHNQGGIGRVMDIGFYHRSIDAELLAIFQIEFHGGLHYESIDGCQRGRGEPVEGTVESIVLGHGVTVELRKGAQCEAIVDAIAQVAVVLTRMRTNERKVCS